ncbi:MAG: hypothetical protein LBI38_05865 [Oscillospiraceae bacterium]|jgi:predicted  nucleic acid-binding Zn-ribbon protein|nr:hypothetical protein [Oscillospiraceae bacterium]
MDLRTFFVFAETLLKNERELQELKEQQRRIDDEVATAEREIPALSESIKRQTERIKKEAKKSAVAFEGKVDYGGLKDWLAANMSSFDRVCAPVLQALTDDGYSPLDRASVLATMYPEIFAKFLELTLNSPTELTEMVNEKNDMVKRQIEFEKRINQLSLTKTSLSKRIPKVEGAYNFPLKQILEIVSLKELEAWEGVLPLIKKLKVAAAEAEKAARSHGSPGEADDEMITEVVPIEAVPVEAAPLPAAPLPAQAIQIDAVPVKAI